MILGTSKSLSCIALALIPPGNVLASIQALRGGLFRRYDAAGARAFFDYPVLAWLSASPRGDDLAEVAASLRAPIAFDGVVERGGAWFLSFGGRFKDELEAAGMGLRLTLAKPRGDASGFGGGPETGCEAEACYDETRRVQDFGSGFRDDAPFEAGIGLYLAPAAELSADRAELQAFVEEALGSGDFRAASYVIAALELSYYADGQGGSSWASLSSARAGYRGGGKKKSAEFRSP